jgi:DNA-binding CsgD family transcriptional regulator
MLNDLLEQLYSVATETADWAAFLGQMVKVYVGDEGFVAGIQRHDFNDGAGSFDTMAGWDIQHLNIYREYFSKINPLLPLTRRAPVGGLEFCWRYIDKPTFQATEFYQDFHRPYRPDRPSTSTGAVLQRSAGRTLGFTFTIPDDVLDRKPSVIREVGLIVPHVKRAVQIQSQLWKGETRFLSSNDVFEYALTALVVLDDTRRVIFLNKKAERIVHDNDGIYVKDGYMCAFHISTNDLLQTLITATLAASHDPTKYPGGVLRIHRRSGTRPYEILVTPLMARRSLFDIRPASVCIFIRDPAQQIVAPVDWMRTLYGLSVTEGRLVGLLLAGKPLNEAGKEVGLTIESARTILKSIFRKTNTNRQTELVRLSLRGIGGLSK